MRAAHALLFSAHRPVGEDNYIVTPRRQKREKRRVQRITLSRTLEFISTTKYMILLQHDTNAYKNYPKVENWKI